MLILKLTSNTVFYPKGDFFQDSCAVSIKTIPREYFVSSYILIPYQSHSVPLQTNKLQRNNLWSYINVNTELKSKREKGPVKEEEERPV